MFDFERLEVYQKIRQLNLDTDKLLKKAGKDLDPQYLDQWKRASLSILLNIAEGAGRQAKNDKKHFYTIARGSLNECVALLDLAFALEIINKDDFHRLHQEYEKASKMLYSLYRSVK
jgi:four helix bundle protein